MTIVIRPATPDDAAGVVAVFNPIIASGRYTTFVAPFSVEAERAYIAGLGPRDIFHVAVTCPEHSASEQVHGTIVGFQSLSPFSTYTAAFDHVGTLGTFVALNYRRQGVARRLFAATFEAARAQGYEKLFTYIRADNAAGLAAYLNQGFQVVGTAVRHAKIGDRYVDEIMIERFLA